MRDEAREKGGPQQLGKDPPKRPGSALEAGACIPGRLAKLGQNTRVNCLG